MRYLRSVTIGMATLAMVVLFSGVALAEMGYGICKGWKAGKEDSGAQIIVLKDSASALSTSNPALARTFERFGG